MPVDKIYNKIITILQPNIQFITSNEDKSSYWRSFIDIL